MPTIRDVAREAGVSIATVSHVLNGTRPVRSDTAARVESVVKDLDYRPLAFARNLRRGKTTLIGLLVEEVSNPLFPEVAEAFEEAAREAGWDVVLGVVGHDPDRARKAVEQQLDAGVRGVAILAPEAGPGAFEIFERRNVPMVFMDRLLDARSEVIGADHERAVDLAVTHLEGLGHTDLAFVGERAESSIGRAREAAFRASIERREGIEGVVIPSLDKEAGAREAVVRLVSATPRPTGVVCSSDLAALSLVSALHSAGVRVPSAVSVVGVDGIGLGEIGAPPLTTVSLRAADLSREAFRVLDAMIEGEDATPKPVPPRLVERASTASPLRS